LNKKIKKILKVKKFIKKKLNGGKLKEVKPPKINIKDVSKINFFKLIN
tara:strand:- start:278 stop:421 length:144 start_codon:yes stop_codon:yes gene_type:complete